MIIDCHAHVFQHWAGTAPFPSSEVHRKYIQKVQRGLSRWVFRARDGKEVSGVVLFREGEKSVGGVSLRQLQGG